MCLVFLLTRHLRSLLKRTSQDQSFLGLRMYCFPTLRPEGGRQKRFRDFGVNPKKFALVSQYHLPPPLRPRLIVVISEDTPKLI